MTLLEWRLLQANENGAKYMRVGDTLFYLPKPVPKELLEQPEGGLAAKGKRVKVHLRREISRAVKAMMVVTK